MLKQALDLVPCHDGDQGHLVCTNRAHSVIVMGEQEEGNGV